MEKKGVEWRGGGVVEMRGVGWRRKGWRETRR